MAVLAALLFAGAAALARPAPAHADASTTPIATSYLAHVTHAPAGIEAKVVDGYVELWMRAPAGETVEVIDQLGAPYLRFDGSGVSVNHNSIEYYVSQLPVPALPPANLTASSPPHWVKVSGGHSHTWRDGRLHALTQEAIDPGTRILGGWYIPLRVDGAPARIDGEILYAPPPSIVWLWPIAVIILCAGAALRLRRPGLDARLGHGLTALLLVLLAVAAAAKELHGRPTVSPAQYVLLGLILVAAGWAGTRLAIGRSGTVMPFVVAALALWTGLTFGPVLTHHYPMLALTPVAARALTVLLTGGAVSLAMTGVRLVSTGMAAGREARRRTVTA